MITSVMAALIFILTMGFIGYALNRLNGPPATDNTDIDNEKEGFNDADARSVAIEKINALLPQTQCAQCGYPGCRPYAQAIIDSDAPINQCPPGGKELIKELAELLGKPAQPLNDAYGAHKPPQIALIDEAECIGCTLCIPVCPVDAIVGASKLMHTVITDQCTGCELCLPPCPVDCISLVAMPQTLTQWQWPKP